jgi:hypothetical protein
VEKSIARNAWLGAAALAVAAGCAVTIASESGLATAKPPPGCSKSSNCAGAAGTGGTNAKGSRLVTTVAGQVTTKAGQVTTVPGTPIDTTFTTGASLGTDFVCASSAGCTIDIGTGPFTLGGGESITSGFITCVSNCIEQTGTGPPTTVTGSPTTITGPPTTETQEGSANGGRTVSQVGSSAPSTVTGHH